MKCSHPFIWPNGDCIDCDVLATTMPRHAGEYHYVIPRALKNRLELGKAYEMLNVETLAKHMYELWRRESSGKSEKNGAWETVQVQKFWITRADDVLKIIEALRKRETRRKPE